MRACIAGVAISLKILLLSIPYANSYTLLGFQGSCDRFMFEAWLKQVLIPEIPMGYVLIMDNASFHKGGNIYEIVAMAGCSIF